MAEENEPMTPVADWRALFTNLTPGAQEEPQQPADEPVDEELVTPLHLVVEFKPGRPEPRGRRRTESISGAFIESSHDVVLDLDGKDGFLSGDDGETPQLMPAHVTDQELFNKTNGRLRRTIDALGRRADDVLARRFENLSNPFGAISSIFFDAPVRYIRMKTGYGPLPPVKITTNEGAARFAGATLIPAGNTATCEKCRRNLPSTHIEQHPETNRWQCAPGYGQYCKEVVLQLGDELDD